MESLLFNLLLEIFQNFQLDIVFHFNKVYALLDEFILAGEVQETNKRVILDRLKDLEKME
jgi:AP-2 complex subunit sigma-1